jgi:hypothetical protein
LNRRLRHLVPALIIASGILVGTFLSTRLAESGGLVIMGPFVLAGSIVLASEFERRIHASSRKRVWVAAAVAGIYVAAASIIGFRDPNGVADVVPLLGAGAIVVLAAPGARGRCCSGDTHGA